MNLTDKLIHQMLSVNIPLLILTYKVMTPKLTDLQESDQGFRGIKLKKTLLTVGIVCCQGLQSIGSFHLHKCGPAVLNQLNKRSGRIILEAIIEGKHLKEKNHTVFMFISKILHCVYFCSKISNCAYKHVSLEVIS